LHEQRKLQKVLDLPGQAHYNTLPPTTRRQDNIYNQNLPHPPPMGKYTIEEYTKQKLCTKTRYENEWPMVYLFK